MLKKNYLLNVLIASIHFVFAVACFELSPNIQKCKHDDSACVSNLFSQLIQNGREYPELNIPDLEHYQPEQIWTVQAHNLFNLVSYTVQHSNISLYGLNTFQVLQFSGLSLNNTDIYMELLFPWVKSSADFNTELELLSLVRIPASGHSNSTYTSLKVCLNLKIEFIQRKGEQYLQINSIDSSYQIQDEFKADIQLDTRIPKILQDAADELANSKWKQLKPIMETQFNERISEIMLKTLAPIFAKVPLKDFFL